MDSQLDPGIKIKEDMELFTFECPVSPPMLGSLQILVQSTVIRVRMTHSHSTTTRVLQGNWTDIGGS